MSFGRMGLGFSRMGGSSVKKAGPTLVFSGSATIPENTPVGFSLGALSVAGGTGSYTYSFAGGGNPGSKFSITGSTLFLAGALDIETTASYALVIAADNGGPTLTLNLGVIVGLVDDEAPTVSTVAFSSTGGGSSGFYVAGNSMQVTATFNEAVLVPTGTPQIALNVGGVTRQASYLSGSGTAALVFAYTIQAGDTDANGVSIGANSLALNGGLIQDTAGNNAVLTHGSVADQANQKVDTTAPTVSSVAITSNAGADNTYIAGDVVQATATFSEAVTISGTPQLTMNVGGSNKLANYASGSGGTAIVFAYTVQAGDTDANGVSIAANALALNSGTIADVAGNAATLTHGSVADNILDLVDTTAPTISSFSPANGASGAPVGGDLTATFSENIAFNTVVSITLKKTSDDSTVQAFTQADVGGALTISGAVLRINPTANLSASTGYYVLIGSTSVTDIGGNFFAGIALKTTWAFTSGTLFTARQFAVSGAFIATSGARQWLGSDGFVAEA